MTAHITSELRHNFTIKIKLVSQKIIKLLEQKSNYEQMIKIEKQNITKLRTTRTCPIVTQFIIIDTYKTHRVTSSDSQIDSKLLCKYLHSKLHSKLDAMLDKLSHTPKYISDYDDKTFTTKTKIPPKILHININEYKEYFERVANLQLDMKSIEFSVAFVNHLELQLLQLFDDLSVAIWHAIYLMYAYRNNLQYDDGDGNTYQSLYDVCNDHHMNNILSNPPIDGICFNCKHPGLGCDCMTHTQNTNYIWNTADLPIGFIAQTDINNYLVAQPY